MLQIGNNVFNSQFGEIKSLLNILETWKNKDESSNKEQKYDEEMIRDAKRSEVEQELRKQVDVLMREELDLLKIVSRYIMTCY